MSTFEEIRSVLDLIIACKTTRREQRTRAVRNGWQVWKGPSSSPGNNERVFIQNQVQPRVIPPQSIVRSFRQISPAAGLCSFAIQSACYSYPRAFVLAELFNTSFRRYALPHRKKNIKDLPFFSFLPFFFLLFPFSLRRCLSTQLATFPRFSNSSSPSSFHAFFFGESLISYLELS